MPGSGAFSEEGGYAMILALMFALLFGLSACSHQPANATTEEYELPRITRTQAQGEEIYSKLCVHCHGTSGDGFGTNSSNLPVAVPDLRAQTDRNESIKRFIEALSARGPDSYCPPWDRRLAPVEIESVAAYIATLGDERRQ